MTQQVYSPNFYLGDDSEDTFPYTFTILANTELVVYETDEDNVTEALVLTTDYTVDGVGDVGGGTITLVGGNLADGHSLSIFRSIPYTQNLSIKNQGPYFPKNIELAIDKLTKLTQQLELVSKFCVQLPAATAEDDAASYEVFDRFLPAGIFNADAAALMVGPAGFSLGPTSTAIEGAEDAADAAAASAVEAAASAAAASTSVGINSPYGINNVGLSVTSATSALTIALKQSDGTTDPAAGSGASIVVVHDPATVGGTTKATVTSALSIVIPSGATLGLNDDLEDFIYIYGYKYVISGLLELAVSASNHWEDGVAINTTVLNTSSDDASTMYSTAARTGVFPRLLARKRIRNSTAGAYVLGLESDANIQFFDVLRKEGNVFARAANFTAKHGNTYLLDTSTARSVQLPTPRAGLRFRVKDAIGTQSSNNTTYVRHGSEKIETVAASFVVTTDLGAIEFISDGTDWFAITL